MITWPQNGIHEAVPFSIYRADDITQADTIETIHGNAVSKSLITDFIPDPGRWKVSQKKEKTSAMGFGSLVDCLLLEEHKFESRYTVSPYADFRKKEAHEWRAEMDKAGVQVVTEDVLLNAHNACAAVRRNPHAAELLLDARTQVAFRHGTAHGVASKGLIDIVPTHNEMLVDLKTCNQSVLEDKRSLQRNLFEWGYHIQAGAYLNGWNIATGEERTRFKFIFVTSSAPFICAVIELPFCAISFGFDQYSNGIARLVDCFERNVWPSQWDGVVEVDLPEYAYL